MGDNHNGCGCSRPKKGRKRGVSVIDPRAAKVLAGLGMGPSAANAVPGASLWSALDRKGQFRNSNPEAESLAGFWAAVPTKSPAEWIAGLGSQNRQQTSSSASPKLITSPEAILYDSCEDFETLIRDAIQMVLDFEPVIWAFFNSLAGYGQPMWGVYNAMRPVIKGWTRLRVRCPNCTSIAHSLTLINHLALCRDEYLVPLEEARQAERAVDSRDGARKCLVLDVAAVIVHELWHRAEYAMGIITSTQSSKLGAGAGTIGTIDAAHRVIQQLPSFAGEARALTFEMWFRYLVAWQVKSADGQFIVHHDFCCHDTFLDPMVGFNTPAEELLLNFGTVAPRC